MKDEDHITDVSRRTVLKATVMAVAAGMALRVPAQQQKIAKNLVQYQDHPNGDRQCSKCVQFQPPDACNVVEGTISPTGWCAAFAPKG